MMLTIKDRIILWKLNRLVNKRNSAFFRGDYETATKYGLKVDHCMNQLLAAGVL